MKSNSILEGGCLCGAVRYRVEGEPFAAEYCHCRMCQKSAGAAVVNWMDLRSTQFTWTRGTPREYQSSQYVFRGFCENCGGTLTYRHTKHPGYLAVTIASLDDPNQVAPGHHIYVESQLVWLNISDNCPRYAKERTSTTV